MIDAVLPAFIFLCPFCLHPDKITLKAHMIEPSCDITQKTLDRAKEFYFTHRELPGIDTSFKYFIDHPIAKLNRKRLALIVDKTRKVADVTKLHALDVACGGGILTLALNLAGLETLGVDLDQQEINLANTFFADAKAKGQFAALNVFSENWKTEVETLLKGKPRVVLLAYALHHLKEVEKFVADLSSWLDPGSVLIINEENPRSPTFKLKHFVRSIIQRDTDIEYHRSYNAWRSLLEKNGFTVSKPTGADVMPYLATLCPVCCWSIVFTAKKT